MNALLAFAGAGAMSPGIAFLRARHLESRLRQLSKEVHMSRLAMAWTTTALVVITGGGAALIADALPLGARQDAARAQDDGVTLPVPVKTVQPEYTPAAMRERIQGTVLLEAVVETDGTVGAVTITRSLDKEHGLDEAARNAARQWQFKPGMRNGKPSRVVVSLEMTFTLRTDPPA
jgi:TonB family protein